METKERSGSERVPPDSRRYLAIERACQSALSSHPKDKALSALRVVKALDRAAGPLFALFLAQHPTGPCRALVGSRHGA